MPGQFWVIEGPDAVGKSTQAELLITRLRADSRLLGHKVHFWHFPHYDGKPWGPLIKEYLAGKLGLKGQDDPYYAGLLYAADRGQQAAEIKEALNQGDWVVADRYMPSNLAYQGSRIQNEAERGIFYDWLERVEYQDFQIVRPDGVIVLTINPEDGYRRLLARAGGDHTKLDILEQDKEHIQLVAKAYPQLAKKHKWPVIPCIQGKKELTREEISTSIWQLIEPHIKA